MKNLGLLLLLVFSLNIAMAQQGVQFIEDKSWEEVLAVAKKENKVVFLDAYTTWCGPCKKMSRDIFPLSSVSDTYNSTFINVKMDMEKGDGIKVARRYGIRVFPTLLYVNSEGEVLHRIAGFQNEKQLLTLAKDAIDPMRQLAGLKRKYNAGVRNESFLYTYAYACKNALENRTYYTIANEYLNTQKDWSSKKNMKFILDFVTRTDAKMFDYLLDNRTAFETSFGKTPINRTVERLVSTRIDQLLSFKDGETDKIFEEAKVIFSKVYPDRAKGLTASFKMTYHRNGGDRKNFALAAIEYVDYMPTLSADELSDIAWTFYRVIEDKKQLKLALKWSRKALKMQKEITHYDTVASLYYKLGKKRKARKYAKKGIKFAKSKNEAHDNLSELLELTK